MIKATTAAGISGRLDELANPQQAAILARFFKTGPGEYGQGDRFLGIKVPVIRRVAREFRELPLGEVKKLLASPIHEKRLAALVILTLQYPRASADQKQAIYDFYLAIAPHINNWDLVDVSAPNIVGAHLLLRDRSILRKLARSKSLWERRIAILSTLAFIRAGQFGDTIEIAQLLLADKHDLIHKAVGWMLREVGKRSLTPLRTFLDAHAHRMPRTMLRYAIERLDEEERRAYLRKES